MGTTSCTLMVGTNRKELLDDPVYLGIRKNRITGDAYNKFIETFVSSQNLNFLFISTLGKILVATNATEILKSISS